MDVVIIKGGSESSTQPELNPNVVFQPIHVFLHTSECVRLEVQLAIVAGNDTCALCRSMVYNVIRLSLKFYHTTPHMHDDCQTLFNNGFGPAIRTGLLRQYPTTGRNLYLSYLQAGCHLKLKIWQWALSL